MCSRREGEVHEVHIDSYLKLLRGRKRWKVGKAAVTAQLTVQLTAQLTALFHNGHVVCTHLHTANYAMSEIFADHHCGSARSVVRGFQL